MRRYGFTLIEMLAATALAAAMLTALMGVIGALTRPLPEHVVAGGGHGWQARISQRLDADLVQAQRYVVEGDVLRIDGWSSIDTDTFAATHEPVTVRYRLERHDSAGGVLIREQESRLEDRVGDKPHRMIVCIGVSQFNLITRTDSQTGQPKLSRVRIEFEESNAPAIERSVPRP